MFEQKSNGSFSRHYTLDVSPFRVVSYRDSLSGVAAWPFNRFPSVLLSLFFRQKIFTPKEKKAFFFFFFFFFFSLSDGSILVMSNRRRRRRFLLTAGQILNLIFDFFSIQYSWVQRVYSRKAGNLFSSSSILDPVAGAVLCSYIIQFQVVD